MYAPNNVNVYVAAYAGAYAGMVASSRVDQNAVAGAAGKQQMASVAQMFAQAVDTAWGASGAAVLDQLSILLIQEYAEAEFEFRAVPTTLSFSAFGSSVSGGPTVVGFLPLAENLVANIQAAETNFSGQEISVPLWPIPTAGVLGGIAYGSGQDGNATFDGVTTFPSFATLTGSTYALTRDVYLNSIEVKAGVSLYTAGYKLFVANTATIDAGGVVHNNGNSAAGASAGAGSAIGTLGIGTAGGAGHAGVGAGSAGTNQVNPLQDAVVAGLCAGGPGGAAGANAGGAAGTYAGGAGTGGANWLLPVLSGFLFSETNGANQALLTIIGGGSGGGGGASDNAAANGGGGGGGGGLLAFHALNLVNNGTIEANGGSGAAGAGTAGDAGGGGGGGGGIIMNLSRYRSGSGVIQCLGGAGGPGFGAGAAGTAGEAGHINNFVF